MGATGVRLRRRWAGAGFGLACLGLAGVAGTLTPAFGGLSRNLEAVLDTTPDGPPARVTLGPGGRDVRLWGDLNDGTAARLRALLDAHPA